MKILFLHHSVGRYLIRDGELRAILAATSLELWDHDYNKFGLTDSTGTLLGRAFPMPGDDTDPPGFLRLFGGDDDEARAAREQVLAFDVIALKSCYPNSGIRDQEHIDRMMATYRELLSALGAIPEHHFVLLTSPPLVPLRTNAEEGRHARSVTDWLAGPAAANIPNVRVFDLFDRLAEPAGAPQANRLRKAYRRRLPVDSHPNRRAGREVARELITVLEAASEAAREQGGARSG